MMSHKSLQMCNEFYNIMECIMFLHCIGAGDDCDMNQYFDRAAY